MKNFLGDSVPDDLEIVYLSSLCEIGVVIHCDWSSVRNLSLSGPKFRIETVLNWHSWTGVINRLNSIKTETLLLLLRGYSKNTPNLLYKHFTHRQRNVSYSWVTWNVIGPPMLILYWRIIIITKEVWYYDSFDTYSLNTVLREHKEFLNPSESLTLCYLFLITKTKILRRFSNICQVLDYDPLY